MFQEEDRASPIAFTVDVGGHDSSEEKQKKLERFALRSSQRKSQSPRVNTNIDNVDDKQIKTSAKTKMRTVEPCRDDIRLAPTGAKPFQRQKSDLSRERDRSRRRTTIISPGKVVTNVSSEIDKDEHAGKADRMDVKTPLPFHRSGMVKQRQEKNEDDYNEDTFDSDSDDNEDNVNDKPESDPSETGTYTVDKDEENEDFQV